MSKLLAIRSDAEPGAYDTLILGLGNVLWADEGFGIRCVEAFNARYSVPDHVRLMDGGTQGIFLLPWVRSAARLLIFDAVDYGLEPATLKLIVGDDVPRFMGAKKISMHQAGFQEVLSSAELAGGLPASIALIGVQPALLDDYGGSLTRGVKAQIPAALALATEVLARWGITLERRAKPPSRNDLTGPDALDMRDYEDGRPAVGGGKRCTIH